MPELFDISLARARLSKAGMDDEDVSWLEARRWSDAAISSGHVAMRHRRLSSPSGPLEQGHSGTWRNGARSDLGTKARRGNRGATRELG